MRVMSSTILKRSLQVHSTDNFSKWITFNYVLGEIYTRTTQFLAIDKY